jgi:hypothetical protein
MHQIMSPVGVDPPMFRRTLKWNATTVGKRDILLPIDDGSHLVLIWKSLAEDLSLSAD